ncbi:MAG: hypothetical protein IJY70_05250, partial [Clostridia bacterium]|nr:hypothetical protein [Clostridia bacterium]
DFNEEYVSSYKYVKIAPPTVASPASAGLPAGAVVGIVLGSVAVAGVGGFALFWFVIKKKSFADLIAVFKSIFKKK